MKCTPVTQKAKSSPFKMNAALVQNDAQVHKGFVDVAGAMGNGMDETQKRINSSRTKQEKPKVDETLPIPTVLSKTTKSEDDINKTKQDAAAAFGSKKVEIKK